MTKKEITAYYFGQIKGIVGWYKRRFINEHDSVLINSMYQIIKTEPDINLRRFTQLLFLLHMRLKQKGVDMKLPYYWYTYGVEIEWESLRDRLNNCGYTLDIRPEFVKT